MTISEIRLENARRLANECGGNTRFAERLAMGASQVSHLIGEKPIKNIGNAIARRIEAAFDKPKGWLDRSHGSVTAEASAAASDIFEAVAPDYLKAKDLIQLIDLFSKSTAKGRKFILDSAVEAEKLAVSGGTRAAGN